jgi:erythromycin esterase
METQSEGQPVSPEHEAAIVAWLQQNAIPVQSLKAGTGFVDLQPLRTLLKDVKVVGLGENTHGTREFFQLKHRLLEFLVTEMNFTALVLEASFAACQPINDFVLFGKGDRKTILTRQGYVAWDTEEFSELLDWLRAYNQRVPNEKKVRFYGVDLGRNEIGRQAVLDYLRQVAPDRFVATQALFELLAREEAKCVLQVDEATERTLGQLLPQLQGLIDHLIMNKDQLIGRSSFAEFEQSLQYTQVMKQWLIANSAELLPESWEKHTARSRFMAYNLIYLVEQAGPDAKFVLWEHNYHLSHEDLWTGEPNMGHVLREQYGDRYYAFGFEFNQGAFLTRTVLPEKLFGDLKVVTLPPAPERSFPWYLSRIKRAMLILDIRAAMRDPLVAQWVTMVQTVHNAGWAYDEELRYYHEWSIAKKYDGIIFVESTTPSRPTDNALNTVAAREGL